MGDTQADAQLLRMRLAEKLTVEGRDPEWCKVVGSVPRHKFLPGFFVPAGEQNGMTVWEPVTEALDRERWLTSAYADETLITQIDEIEPGWDAPTPHVGGRATSSATLPSLVVQMWEDAQLEDGHRILEVGTGTGYSTALLCERFGSSNIASIEIDPHRLAQAADAIHSCGYAPWIAAADGLYGYWPRAPYDRIVAACSVRAVPREWVNQTRNGGKILTTLGGWLYGYARVLLTIRRDETVSGPLLPGTISFMSARGHERPAPGNPAHWESLPASDPKEARHAPWFLMEASTDAFATRFIVQAAIPNAQHMPGLDGCLHLVDVVSGSVATLTPNDGTWTVRQGGPLRLWDRVEETLDRYETAGRPPLDTFSLDVHADGQYLSHPDMPRLRISA
ncbi:ATP-grasp peptide maturase system methyltransferase [Thermopolyspora sp. NPDC052614]|uniref:ATP-grasp peptide maturase system methyltransferase n=1 Tax=Thermopolyspora sp. NPDC052614 TaxID=3155682 RepID=UPI003422425B